LTSAETVIAAALISSAPGWAAVYVTVSNRLALKKQTDVLREDTAAQTNAIRRATTEQTAQIKAHIDTSGTTSPAEGQREAGN
jgi:hypothetical protein